MDYNNEYISFSRIGLCLGGKPWVGANIIIGMGGVPICGPNDNHLPQINIPLPGGISTLVLASISITWAKRLLQRLKWS